MPIHYNTNQTTIPLEISSFLPQDHLVFTIEKVVNTLEDCHFDAFYHAFGYPFYHPKMLVSTLLFSYLQEILSGQEIANEEYTSYSETDPLKIKNDKGKKNIGIVRQVIENETGIKVYVVVSSDKSLWYTISKSALDIFVK
ncbi:MULTISPECIES: transposase [Streptococcus]|uniref:transposase n=1 Tax=Streptococcus sp. HMSC070B10 TaxID=1715092 RepID=UPI000B11166F